jgi:hypothetical protein
MLVITSRGKGRWMGVHIYRGRIRRMDLKQILRVFKGDVFGRYHTLGSTCRMFEGAREV